MYWAPQKREGQSPSTSHFDCCMAPELETLDQLLGGDLPLPVIRGLFADQERFVLAIYAMLEAGETRLFEAGGADVPKWRWHDILCNNVPSTRLAITKAGAKRIV